METAAFLVGNRQVGTGMILFVKVFSLVSAIGLASVLLGLGEENSAQRLENAQEGIVGSSWPRKPDQRLSSLSGKMKDTGKITPKIFGQDREFRTRQLGEWNQESRLGSAARWEGGSARSWEQTRWNQDRDWSGSGQSNKEFQPAGDLTEASQTGYREIQPGSAPDWSSRSSRLGGATDGSLRRYEGRLTRVREQVRQEEKSVRDLGPDRPEKFQPADVEKILSQPLDKFAPQARERSPSASPLATAGN